MAPCLATSPIAGPVDHLAGGAALFCAALSELKHTFTSNGSMLSKKNKVFLFLWVYTYLLFVVQKCSGNKKPAEAG